MTTLFQMSTLASWTTIVYIQWYGCDRYTGGLYEVEVSSDSSTTSESYVQTETGLLRLWKCDITHATEAKGESFAFFVVYTMLTGFVILSLFIGVITMGMMDAFDDAQQLKSKNDYDRALKEVNEELMDGDQSKQLHQLLSAALSETPSFGVPQEGNHGRPLTASRFWSTFVKAADLAMAVEQHEYFNNTVTAAILTVGVTIGLQTDKVGDPAALRMVNHLVLVVFTVEVAVKVLALKWHPWRYFNDPWNRFDFIVVLNSYIELAGVGLKALVLFRLLRLLRVFRLAKSFPRLQSIVESLVKAFASIGSEKAERDDGTSS